MGTVHHTFPIAKIIHLSLNLKLIDYKIQIRDQFIFGPFTPITESL